MRVHSLEIDDINKKISDLRDKLDRYVESSVERSMDILKFNVAIPSSYWDVVPILSISEIEKAMASLFLGPSYPKSLKNMQNPYIWDHLQKYHHIIKPVGLIITWKLASYFDDHKPQVNNLIVIASNGDFITEYVPGYESIYTIPNFILERLFDFTIIRGNDARRFDWTSKIESTHGHDNIKNVNITAGDYGNAQVVDISFMRERALATAFKMMLTRQHELMKENNGLKEKIEITDKNMMDGKLIKG